MPIVVRLLQRAVHLYQRHNRIESRMQQLRGERLQQLRVYHCQRILLHRLDHLRTRPKDSCQRYKQHRPGLPSLHDGEILRRNEPKLVRKLDSMQCYHRN